MKKPMVSLKCVHEIDGYRDQISGPSKPGTGTNANLGSGGGGGSYLERKPEEASETKASFSETLLGDWAGEEGADKQGHPSCQD